ncbi:MAG: DEAD/DEAH box helicase [Bacteroidetes bacterium]|nr:DEAD/DEAH box helicase [Bacteroidota bacterium]
MTQSFLSQRPQEAKKLYPYQEEAIKKILAVLLERGDNSNILFQLPTGGGKTVIFSEIVRRFIHKTNQKVLILTHRIELLRQTLRALNETGVPSRLVTSEVKELDKNEENVCYLAMVETLSNRLQEDHKFIGDIDLVIVDEAHYNSFKKIFKYFEKATILGVTATPLSSNLNLPLNRFYQKVIVGQSISSLIELGYLSDATTLTYDVDLKSLKIGFDGDYTTSSLDQFYSNYDMQDKLLAAYAEKSKGLKTLIFNSSIATSKIVKDLFTKAGYEIKHLDSTNNKVERKATLEWFRKKPDAILTSVGILTTGFDEPTVESIILNRATRSLTLYHQMIGRGSRRLPNKSHFNIIDLGDNARRLGLWQEYIDWAEIFVNPWKYIEYLNHKEQEMNAVPLYRIPDEVKDQFPNTDYEDFEFNVIERYEDCITKGQSTTGVIDECMEHHLKIILDNANDDLFRAIELLPLLDDEINFRLQLYTSCMSKTTPNYFAWLYEDYIKKLKSKIRVNTKIIE